MLAVSLAGEEALVAKVAQPGMDNRKIVAEFGAGTDIVAILIMQSESAMNE